MFVWLKLGLGTQASLAIGGHRVPQLLTLRLTISTLILLTLIRRTTTAFAGLDTPSAALVPTRRGRDVMEVVSLAG